MTNHVTVGEINTNILIFTASEALNKLIGDLSTLHPRTLLEGNDVRWDLNVCLKLLGELTGLITVPEIGNMTVLLSLGDSEHINSLAYEIFCHSICDLRGRNKITGRNVKVTIILKHTCVKNSGNSLSVKLIKISTGLERLRDLDSSVTTEVVEDNTVAVIYCTNSLTILCNNKGRKILVDYLKLCSISIDSLLCGRKLSALTKHVSLPSALNHRPVCFISVHSNLHSAATGRDANIKAVISYRGKELLIRKNVIKCAGLTNVTTIKENMKSYSLNAILFRLLDKCAEVINVRVNITVREKTDKMKCGIILLYSISKSLPCLGCKDLARFNRLRNKLCALCEYLTGAKSIMSNLRVTHIVIAGKTNSSAVSLKRNHGILAHKHIKCGSMSCGNSICTVIGSNTNTVHNYCEKRTLNALEFCRFVKSFHLFSLSNIKYRHP